MVSHFVVDRCFPLLGLLWVASAFVVHGDDDYPIYVYPCPLVADAPKVDGRLDDPCWAKAPLVSGFTFYNKRIAVEVQTSFRVAYDGRHLYLAVTCDEPLMKLVVPQPTQRDDRNVFRQECIEAFVDPHHTHKRYHQFAFCVAGTFYDSLLTNAAWDSQARAAVQQLANAWTLEVAIPWADLEVDPKPGKVVGINICRDRLVGRSREWTNWSQTKANFHDPARFGHLVLSGTDERIAQLAQEFRKGERRGPIHIFGHGGYSKTAYVALARQSLRDLDELMAELFRTGAKESSPATRKEIESRLAKARARLAPSRKAVQGAQQIDAAHWHRLSQDLQKLRFDLSNMIWEARLQALLDGM